MVGTKIQLGLCDVLFLLFVNIDKTLTFTITFQQAALQFFCNSLLTCLNVMVECLI